MEEYVESLLSAATRAPSGDNTQPWRFVVEGDSVAFELDEARDPSPMNAGQRMSRIGVGAALENLTRAAEGLGVDVESDPDPAPYLARVRLRGVPRHSGGLDPLIVARVTNRRDYDGRPVPPEVLARLSSATPELGGVTTHWVVGPERLKPLAEAIGGGDALMFGEPSMRNAFLGNVRFDRPAAEAVDEGLSIGSLEVGTPDRLALRIMRRMPDRLLKIGGASNVFRGKARQLVTSASGLCVITAVDGQPSTDVTVGRGMQRAWLALTAEGFAAQPMMSLPVLANAVDHGDEGLKTALGPARVSAVLDAFHALAPELEGRRIAWLMRFGHAAAPTGRTGRLAVDRVTSYHPSEAPQGVRAGGAS